VSVTGAAIGPLTFIRWHNLYGVERFSRGVLIETPFIDQRIPDATCSVTVARERLGGDLCPRPRIT
jgi:hypothetical protein